MPARAVDEPAARPRATLLREIGGDLYLGLADGGGRGGELQRLEPNADTAPAVTARLRLDAAPVAIAHAGDLLYLGLAGSPGRLVAVEPETLDSVGEVVLPAGTAVVLVTGGFGGLVVTVRDDQGTGVALYSLADPHAPQLTQSGNYGAKVRLAPLVPRAITDHVPRDAVVDWLRDPTRPSRLLVAASAGAPLRVLDDAVDSLRIHDRNDDGKIRLACVGDSNTAASPFATPSDFCTALLDSVANPDFEVLNVSVIGAAVRNLTDEKRGQTLMNQALAGAPDALILALGTNDLQWFDADDIAASVRSRIAKMKEFEAATSDSGAQFFVALVPPRFDEAAPDGALDALNAAIRASWPPEQVIDFHTGFTPADFLPDGLHLVGRGHAERARRVYDVLLEERALSPAYRADPASRLSPEAAVEQIHFLRVEFATTGAALGLPDSLRAQLDSCADLRAALSTCTPSFVAACEQALSSAFEETAALRDRSTGLRRTTAARLLTETSEVLHLLTSWRTAFAAGHCDALAADGIPARLRLLRDGQSFTLRPLQPLRMGRRYQLVVDAAPGQPETTDNPPAPIPTGESLEEIRHSVWPRPEAPSPFPAAIDATWPDGADFSLDATRTLLADLAHRVAPDSDSSAATVPGFRLRWPRALTAQDLSRLRFRFVPATATADGETLHTFRTRNDRARLLAARERIRAERCVPLDWKPVAPDTIPRLRPFPQHVWSATLPSRDKQELRDGIPATPVPMLLAVPGELDASTPLVVLLHGHSGDARSSFARHAGDLLERGLAVLALDLPDHGGRGERGTRFLSPLDPAAVADHMELAALDVIAAIEFAERCGIDLPGGTQWKPSSFRYLGYSVGSMVGVMVRAIEDRIGTTVLLAAAGDLPGWMIHHIPTALGSGRLRRVCVGGADAGRDCVQDPRCLPPGICATDPDPFELSEQLSMPVGWALAASEPLAWARERTGSGSRAPLLLVTGGADWVLYPLLATRLTDALDMQADETGMRRGPHSRRILFPSLGHELRDDATVRELAADFLANRGRRPAADSQRHLDSPAPAR